jgi:sensor histidine kinase YesM
VENNKRLKKQTEQSTGIGLKNIIERYKLISGKVIVVEETPETFRIILPLIK